VKKGALGFRHFASINQMYGDSHGALALIRNPVHHARSKHIDNIHYAVRERVDQERRFRVNFVSQKGGLLTDSPNH
jgi:hypothetical protein